MKDLQQRQKQILNHLLQIEDFEPVKKFAAILQCSTKTVRNDLMILEECGVALEKVAGRGVRILPSKRSNAESFLQEPNILYDLSIDHRRMKILFELLEGAKDKLSIQSLSNKYFVSKTSIVNDLKVIEEKLAEYHLHLKKDTQGTQLVGSEMDIRKAMVDMLNTLISSKSMTFQEENFRINRETLLELEEHFGKYNVKQVKEIIEEAEELLNYRITEPYYINLVTHILILIHRTKNGKTIYSELKEEDRFCDPAFYEVSEKIANRLETIFSIQINQEEVFYIYRYLMSSGGVVVQEMNSKKSSQIDEFLHEIAIEMISLSSKIFPIKFTFSQSLYNDLILHLKPMMNRIEYKIQIKNPLLAEIKDEFPELMILLKLVILKIRLKYKLPHISEDEISYIAVYFQAAIEEVISKKRVMIVCSTGVGTSHLLEKRVKNHFPEWNVVEVVSAKQLEGKSDLNHIDLIISTVKLNVSLSKPVAYVSALFNKADEKRIRASLVKECQDLVIEEKKAAFIRNVFLENGANKTKFDQDVSQAKCVDCIVINNLLELCVYEKKDLEKEELCSQMACQIRGKNRVKFIVLIKENEDLSEKMLKEVYYFLTHETE
ncbi:MAG: transcriptional antiterminator, BglG [Bacillus sp. (in: firmicutes)]|jgi:activator of the mannose operon (transcriptional antiterminator)|nr:transcriptional antiterminator, BglG [Bacillus sp. (in: firmicutes)]